MARTAWLVIAALTCAGCPSAPEPAPDDPVVERPTPARPLPPVEGGVLVAAPAPPPAPDVEGHTIAYTGAGPALTCLTAQAAASGLRPVGVTGEFSTDGPHVVIIYWADAPIPAGTIRFDLWARGDAGGWTRLGPGSPQETDGTEPRYATGLPLDRPWARNGGSFEFRGYWNDETTPLVVAPFRVTTAKRWLLCVAIADYPPAGPTPGDLPMIDDAAESMAGLLQQGYGFSAERTVIVKDADATSARIQQELLTMAEQAGPDDTVVFYYTGHGCQVPDLDGDEPDGWDEALATADERPPVVTTKEQLALFLVDDRLAELLAKFRTRNVTVIFDSCHSGTAVRAGDADAIASDELGATFRADMGFSRKLVQQAEDAARTGAGAAASALDVTGQYVYISAAQSWEVAQGRTHPFKGGVFSVHLREALANQNGQSWNTLVAAMMPSVHNFWAGQTPRVDGAGQRLPFSLGESPVDAAWVRPSVAVTGANDGQAMVKAAGAVGDVAHLAGGQGLYIEQRGVEYDVFDADDPRLQGAPKGRITLSGDRVDQSTSIAKIVMGVAGQGDRAVPRHMRLPDGTAAYAIGFLGGVAEAQQKEHLGAMRTVYQGLRSVSGLRLAEAAGDPRDYLVLGDVQGGRLELVIATASGLPVARIRGSDLARQAAEAMLARHRAFARLSRLSNPSPPFRLRLEQADADARAAAGAPLSCVVDVSTPAYVYVLSGPDGGPLDLIAFTRALVQPGQQFQVAAATTAAGNKRWVVKVLASTKPLDLDAFRAAAAAEARLEALVAQLRAAHGGEGELIATDGWAEAAIRVHLK